MAATSASAAASAWRASESVGVRQQEEGVVACGGGGVVSLEYVGEGNFVATRAARRRSFRVAFGCCCCCGGADAYKAGKLLLLLF